MNALFKKAIIPLIRNVIFLYLAVSPVTVNSEWSTIQPIPHIMMMEDIQILSHDRIWAMGKNSAVSIFRNGQWEISLAPDINITDFKVFTDESAVAVGSSGSGSELTAKVLVWDGESWTTLLTVPNIGFLGVWGESSQEFFVSGPEGIIYRFSAGSWELEHTGINLDQGVIWGSSSGNVYAAGTSGQYPNETAAIIRRDGVQWMTVGTFENTKIHSIWGFGPDDVYAVGYTYQSGTSAFITHWNGISWQDESVSSGKILLDIWGSDPDNLFAVGTSGCIFHKTAGAWTEMESGVSMDLKAVHGSDSDTVFAFGSDTVWYDMDQVLIQLKNDIWEKLSVRNTGVLMDMTSAGTDRVFAVGHGIYEWDGYTWIDHTPDGSGCLYSVWAAAPDSAFAVGAISSGGYPTKAVIAGWDGTEWSVVSSGVFQTLTDVWGSSANNYYAVGDYGILLEWDGVNWHVVNIDIPGDLNCIWGFSASDVIIGGSYYDENKIGVLYSWDGVSLETIIELDSCVINDIWGISRDDFYLLTNDYHYSTSVGSRILHWNGIDWTTTARFGNLTTRGDVYNRMIGFGSDDIYLFSNNSDAPAIHWDGYAWTEIIVPIPSANYRINAVWKKSPDEIFFCGCGFFVSGLPASQLILHFDGQELPRDLGFRLYQTSKYLAPGNMFQLTGYLDNPQEPLQDIPLFILLDVMGNLYFWPSWVEYSPPESAAIDYQIVDVPNGTTTVSIIPEFKWPDLGDSSLDGLQFYGAMLNQEMNAILGEMAQIEWGFGP